MGLFLTFSLFLMPYIEFICVPNMLCCVKNLVHNKKLIIFKNKAKYIVFQILDLSLH